MTCALTRRVDWWAGLSLMAKPPDYPVLVPYNELCELLDAVKQVREYKSEVAYFRQQVVALRAMQQECFEKLRELEKLV